MRRRYSPGCAQVSTTGAPLRSLLRHLRHEHCCCPCLMAPNTPNSADHDAYRTLAPVMPPPVRHRDPRTAKAKAPAHRDSDARKPRLDTSMKIAIVNQPQDPIVAGEEQRGSVAIVNWELAKRLAQRHEVTVYAPRAPGQARSERWKNIEIRRVPFVAK